MSATRTAAACARALRVAIGIVVVLAIGACTDDATELVVVTDTDLVIPTELDRIAIVVSGPTTTSDPIEVDLSARDRPMLPLTLSVSPGGASLGPVTVRAIGSLRGATVVEAAARTTLVRGEPRVLWLFLGRSCVSMMCGASGERTCREGACADVDVAYDELPRWDGRVPPRDGPTLDAGTTMDGAIDGAPMPPPPPIDAGDAGDASGDAGDAFVPPIDGGPPVDSGPPIDGGPPPIDLGPDDDGGPIEPCPGGCNDGRDCTIDSCDVAMRRCVFTPRDADGDMHGDMACGGDDCNDADAAIHPGATEACDGDDDDCNGTNDDACPCSPIGRSERCMTTCGSAGNRTCGAGGWSDCAPPSETCNVIDDDCDGQIDEGFDYVATAAHAVTTYTNASRRPTIAAVGTNVVVAWQRDGETIITTPRVSIDAVRLNADDGRSTGSIARISGPLNPASWPSIAATADGFGVVFWEPTRTMGFGLADGVTVARLRADGTLIGSASRIEDVGTSTPAPAVAFTGTELAVAYEGSAFFLERVDPASGATIGARARIAGHVNGPQHAIAWRADEHAIAWPDGGILRLSRGTGEPFRTSTIGSRVINDVAMAATARGFVVVGGASDDRVYAFTSDDGGDAFDEATLGTMHVRGTTCASDELHGVAAVPAGANQVLVFWAERVSDMSIVVRMTRIAPDGTLLQSSRDVGSSASMNVQPSAAWVDDHAVLVWSATAGSCEAREIWSTTVGCP